MAVLCGVDRCGRPVRAVSRVEPQGAQEHSATSEESPSAHLHSWFLLGRGVSSLRARQEPFTGATTRSDRTEVTALPAHAYSPRVGCFPLWQFPRHATGIDRAGLKVPETASGVTKPE